MTPDGTGLESAEKRQTELWTSAQNDIVNIISSGWSCAAAKWGSTILLLEAAKGAEKRTARMEEVREKRDRA